MSTCQMQTPTRQTPKQNNATVSIVKIIHLPRYL